MKPFLTDFAFPSRWFSH
ncbi:hypothetical protein ECEC1866_3281, partial [Escherichia coli EC1866]